MEGIAGLNNVRVDVVQDQRGRVGAVEALLLLTGQPDVSKKQQMVNIRNKMISFQKDHIVKDVLICLCWSRVVDDQSVKGLTGTVASTVKVTISKAPHIFI